METRVNHLVTQVTCVVGGTDAGVVVHSVDAGGVVLTVVVLTVVWVYLTTLAFKAWWTHAAEVVFKARLDVAGSSISAGETNTGIDGYFTVATLESIWTGAAVGPSSIRGTGTIVLAGCCQAGGALRQQADVYRTFTLESVEWRGEQEPVSHVRRSRTTSNARLFEASLDPLREPAQVTVTEQGVGTKSKVGQSGQVVESSFWYC